MMRLYLATPDAPRRYANTLRVAAAFMLLAALTPHWAYCQNHSQDTAPSYAGPALTKDKGEKDLLGDALIPSLLGKLLSSQGLTALLDHVKASLQATTENKPAPEMDAQTAEKVAQMAQILKRESASVGLVALERLREQVLNDIKQDILKP